MWRRFLSAALLGGLSGVALTATLPLLPHNALAAQHSPHLLSTGVYYETRGLQQSAFNTPASVTVAANGDYFIADTGNNRIVHYDSKGAMLGTIGRTSYTAVSPQQGGLDSPVSVALDGKDHLYVADLGNHRVAEFTVSGAYLGQIGSFGFAPGQFIGPTAVVVDATGRIGVLDSGADEVNLFGANGKFIMRWGSFGSGINEFDGPGGLALDAKGNFYVSDTNNNRIEEFSPAGAYIGQWGRYGSGDGDLRYPTGVAVDARGNIWVDDTGNNRVVEIQNPTTFEGSIPLTGLREANGITVAGSVAYVVDTTGEQVQPYTLAGAAGTAIGKSGHGLGQLSRPVGVAVDTRGNIYVADTNNNRIQKFNASGASVAVYGKQGKAPVGRSPRFLGPQAIAVDTQGSLYVADTFNGRIEKLDSSGNFVWTVPVSGQPRGIAVDLQGNVYVTSYFNDKVIKYDTHGKVLTSWGGRGASNGLFQGPAAIAVDKAGRVYVADTGNSRVDIFTPGPGDTYIFGGQFGGGGKAEGQFTGLAGIAVAADNSVYAVDAGNQRIERFNPFGAQFTSWSGGSNVQALTGLALDTTGHVVVVDSLSNSVDVYSTTGALVRQIQ